MTTFVISGSIDKSSNTELAPLGSYKTAVYGSISIPDTSRNPLAAIYNASTGSINLNLRQVRVSVSPKGDTRPNDVCFILGATASGSISGSVFVPTPLNPSYPNSVVTVYGSSISGPTIHDPMNGFLVQAQSQNLSTSPNPPILIADVNSQTLDRDKLMIIPGHSYVVTLSELNVIDAGTVFAYVIEFTWDESAGI